MIAEPISNSDKEKATIEFEASLKWTKKRNVKQKVTISKILWSENIFSRSEGFTVSTIGNGLLFEVEDH